MPLRCRVILKHEIILQIMENKTTSPDTTGSLTSLRTPLNISELKKAGTTIKSINLDGDKWVIVDDLPGVYCEGTQYYDLKNVPYINTAGFASLVSLLKSLLMNGVRVQFVNVNEQIRAKMRALGLDHILNCY
jgi:ABC-type transporter Mla MlaB component